MWHFCLHMFSNRKVTICFPLTSFWTQDKPSGVWLESLLMFSELRDEDFNINYTCLASSARGNPKNYFTLLPAGNKPSHKSQLKRVFYC